MFPPDLLSRIAPETPVLIAGPTASGKSALALEIAEHQGGVIVNADALQVFDCWTILSARPPAEDLARAPHTLYGHVPWDAPYSTGHWLRDVAPVLHASDRPIIVGGTGLNLTALTEGLADIPATPPEIRAEADALPHDHMLDELDDKTRARIDTANPARVQRAWEVWRATGRTITDWQASTRPPLLPCETAVPIVIDADKDWLTPRIAHRFDDMLDKGALDEVRAMQDRWDPTLPSAKAIGAPELMAFLNGQIDLATARERAIIASRQYAKRQRTWFRARMKNWHAVRISGNQP
ncbi:tRNA (adenosine(37)-N6)-dimethylallyltransferase MiaA [Litoreibacter roseus]|uniref:tRNA dimethylallyltransferase n=1 Tax=Litoreibacter roseus TaxID=2601869 RepID=A0A6N6JKG1_9RHOB|nr:tRNA (adenosine(37)-N6)-dimethylallyltransferase MiaA [Litoreibacter roseus]GFE66806.1 tRNA dimethylallyltransferase [Litoreibacter roseus]